MEEKNTDQSKELSYDLRQIYAVGIVGYNLQLIQESRMNQNYSEQLRLLRDLHIVIAHNFKKPQEDENKYKELLKNCITIANKYPQTFIGKIRTPNECSILEESLAELEMFLYKKCDEANLFGGKVERDPSKIIGSSR